jgi:uncharacterized protein YjiS (DUF1127 family)
MDPRLFATDPARPGALPDIAAIRAAAAAARDAEVGRMLRQGFSAIIGGLAWLADTIEAWRDRRAAYERLRLMSDRELADIGLNRAEITRVFEPDLAEPGLAQAVRAAAPAVPAAANDAAPATVRAA